MRRKPIRHYPDVVCHRALLREVGAADDPQPDDLGELAEHCSAREREWADVEYEADALCLAWLLDARLFETGWEATFEGEIIGVIASGLFVRFDEVFEGYLPARRLARWRHPPPRRPDRGARPGHPPRRGQGRADACRGPLGST